MRKTIVALATLTALASNACKKTQPTEAPAPTATAEAPPVKDDNPLFVASPLQYEAPNYADVKFDHLRPAFERGMTEHLAEVEAIATSSEEPTFENTMVPLERSGAILDRTSDFFFSLTGTVSNDEIRALQAEVAPKLSAHYDTISLDPRLFARIEAIYAKREGLGAEERRVVEETHENFVRAGAKLSEQAKAEIKEINGELSRLTTEFSQNLLAVTKANAVVVDDVKELAGLSEDAIAGLAAAATEAGMEGRYLINLMNTTRQPIMTQLDNRDLRRRVWEASANRGQAENGPVLVKIAQLRARKAKVLGAPDWATYQLGDRMAKTPAAVLKILDDMAPQVAKKTKAEAREIQKMIRKTGGEFKLEPWDWTYYAEKVRAKKFNLNEDEVRGYFEMNNVMQNGVFFAMNKLFGVRFEERKDLPVYHPDVRTFEVFDESGNSIGLFYADYFAREGKRGGAWMNALVGQSKLLGRKPVVVNCLNVPKPAEGKPALLTFDETQTMFHEMGHAVHGLFSNATYPSLAGTRVPRDFVEFPSQFEEDWAIDPLVLANYTKHYQTGEPIPKALLDKVLASRKFNQGFDTMEYLGAALLDMEWHMVPAGTDFGDVLAFEAKALKKHGVDHPAVPPRYRSTYFAHTFSGGYSAGYYSYMWTEVLAADAFAHMGTMGGLTRANGDKFRDAILSRGNTIDPMQQYINFRGQEPTVDALLKRRGLTD